MYENNSSDIYAQIEQMQYILREVQQTTKSIKYDNVVSEILVNVQQLAQDAKISETEIQYSISNVLESRRQLESSIYKLEDSFKDKLRNLESIRDEAENDDLERRYNYDRNQGNISENKFSYDRKTATMKKDDSDPDQRHGLYINGKLVKAYNTREEAENVKARDAKFRDATIKKIAENINWEIPLVFRKQILIKEHIQEYAIKYFESIGREQPHNKFINNIRRLGSRALSESKEMKEIQGFIDIISNSDSKHTIKIGDMFSVLCFDIYPMWKEIDAYGFTEPKEVTDIKQHSDGTINYIKFADGDRFPKMAHADYNKTPVTRSAYFSSSADAQESMSMLKLAIPDTWNMTVGITNINEGGMGGLNRCAPAQDVSYEKILNDVKDKWRGQTVTVKEMKIGKLQDYKVKPRR